MDQGKPNPAEDHTKHYILGTAGHIDHGKTSLVRALTGIETDRLPEERRRGMTIELGFAHLWVEDVQFGIVDVPGHERFIRTMVAGATGIDLALLVVAADDSVMPQTVEHVEILQLLDVEHAVVALTKTDVVDTATVELVAEDVQEFLKGTSFQDAPICPVSSLTGAGLTDLKRTVLVVARRIHRPSAPQPFRVAVDRVFTVAGRGTVVTGSVVRGHVAEGDILEAWPAGERCRVRGLQTHGAGSERLARGQRAAINLMGIDRAQLHRGVELATPGYLQPSPMLDVRLRCLGTCGRPIKSTSVVRLGMGTNEVPVRIVLIGAPEVEPGGWALAQLRSGTPLFATHGQRFIVRDENATRTIGGGMVLRPFVRRRLRDADVPLLEALCKVDPTDRVEAVLRTAGFVPPTELQLCAQADVELEQIPVVLARLQSAGRYSRVPGTDVCTVPAVIADLAGRLVAWMQRYHHSQPNLPGRSVDTVLGWLDRMSNRTLARPLFELFLAQGTLRQLGRFVCLPEFATSLSAADEKLFSAMLETIRAGNFQPPGLDDPRVAALGDRKRRQRLATLGVALGELVQLDTDVFVTTETEQQLREKVADLIGRCGPVTVAQVREVLQSSRKYVVPFLEYLDRIGFTKRVGDQRVLNKNDRA